VIRVGRVGRVLILATAIALGLARCGGDAAHPSVGTRFSRAIGLADPPPPPSLAIDVVCDASKDSTCATGSLDATLAAMLPAVAERPGSELRLFMVGPDLASTQLVATVRNAEKASANANSAKTAKARFVDASRSSVMTAAQPYLAGNSKGGSPIAEALTLIAMAAVRTDSRIICVISDAREVSAIGGDFECDDPLPTPQGFTKALQRERVLPPGSLAGVRVFFTYLAITPIHRKEKGCVETLGRLAQMKDLWTAAIEAAGGTTQFDTGAIDPATIAPKKGDA
jgi:hypothetical protein